MSSKGKLFAVLLCLALAVSAAAQWKKPFDQWTYKDAEKILNDSPWGQTQTMTDTSEPTYSPGARDIAGPGALNQNTSWNFRIRFISAKPIRQAYYKWLELDPKERTTSDELSQGKLFLDASFDQAVVVAVNYDGLDQRFKSACFQAFSTAITSTLKNNTWLDIKGRPRVFLQEYKAPSGFFGALFTFPRIMEGKPIIDASTGDVRFYAEFPKLSGNNPQVKLDMRFKVKDFLYNGVLEF